MSDAIDLYQENLYVSQTNHNSWKRGQDIEIRSGVKYRNPEEELYAKLRDSGMTPGQALTEVGKRKREGSL